MPSVIIPELVTCDSNVMIVRGSNLFRKLGFFPETSSPAQLHYRLLRVAEIHIPKTYDFRYQYYVRHNGTWFYQRKLPFGLSLKFSYDPKTRTFSFNRLFHLVPFEIGSIMPVGRHIADIINLELTLAGYIVMRGFACTYGGRSLAVTAPPLNGKTSMLRRALESGGQYIASDILVIDHKQHLIYPTAHIDYNYGRADDKNLIAGYHAHQAAGPLPLSQLFCLYNSTSNQADTKRHNFADYLSMNSALFAGNNFMRGYVFAEGVVDAYDAAVAEQVAADIPARVMHIEDFDYDGVFSLKNDQNRLHWEQLGQKYDKVWQSSARDRLKQAELTFVTEAARATLARRVLDVGVGTGRILQAYLADNYAKALYGIDVSAEMVKICRERFQNQPAIKAIETTDLAVDDLPFSQSFDAVSCVRVLKYNPNWPEIVAKMGSRLNPGGVLVFSVANARSLNRFSRYPIPTYKTTIPAVRKLAVHLGLNVVEIAGFTRVPDKFYDFATIPLARSLLNTTERLGALLFGKSLFTRELFVTVMKK